MLNTYEVLLFEREIVNLTKDYSNCTDFSIREILYNQIELLLRVLDL